MISNCDQFYLILSRINRIFFTYSKSSYQLYLILSRINIIFFHSLKIITFIWMLRTVTWMEKLYWFLHATRAAWYKNSSPATSLAVLKKKGQVCLSEQCPCSRSSWPAARCISFPLQECHAPPSAPGRLAEKSNSHLAQTHPLERLQPHDRAFQPEGSDFHIFFLGRVKYFPSQTCVFILWI